MPKYDLKCPHCGAETETICMVAERNNQKCPKCGHSMQVQIVKGMGEFLKSSLRIKLRHKQWIKERGL
jgi:putative FmdB family regulatory protein